MELLDIVDEDDRVIGQAQRKICHGDRRLIHRAVHVLVFSATGRLLLQKRSMRKDIQPGRWDTSVGGHLDPGEGYRAAALREMHEELGICGLPLTYLYPSKIRNEIESENIQTFLCRYDGPIDFARDEIDAVRFWNAEEIEAQLGSGLFTPNFEEEWQLFKKWRQRYQAGIGERALCAGDGFPDLMHRLQQEEL